MSAVASICPQCLAQVANSTGARFCPRCGLALGTLGNEGEPMDLVVGPTRLRVHDRIKYGDLCNLYRCTVHPNGNGPREGVFKIARTHVANKHVTHEANVLKRLHDASGGRLVPFLPSAVTTLNYGQSNGEPARKASVLVYHPDIRTPDELYSLEEVRQAHPNGIDARDMAWMWRRLLTVLGIVHEQRTVHAAVTPAHVLIEPAGHKLVLVGWCGAVFHGQLPVLVPANYRSWIRKSEPATAATDLSMASQTMSSLLGANVEPAITRHLERAAESTSASALRLLDDFDRMIEALWGPRQFRPFAMPARG